MSGGQEGKLSGLFCAVLCAAIVHSELHTHMNRPNSSLDWVLSHLAHFTVLRFIFMVALCNRAHHYIFILFLVSSSLWSPYVIGQTIIFSSCFFLSFFFLFFPRLISAVGDWMFTILWHMVWP